MNKLVEQFVERLICEGYYSEIDKLYLSNRLLHLVGENDTDLNLSNEKDDLITLKDNLVDLAVTNGKIGEFLEEKESLGAQIMDLITPIPSELNKKFWKYYENNPETALNYFYKLSKNNDYIKLKAVSKNIYFPVVTEYGRLDITINLSKPEKDPRSILAARQQTSSEYPKCLLCMENEGYYGRINHPARSNHRIIRLNLAGENWGLQYSPYAYFNEHCIFLSEEHVPMSVTSKTFEQLLDIIDLFPSYFVGSNAGLPIVGGSILSHNHYQGGKEALPMENAIIDYEFILKNFSNVQASILNWPMSVIRLTSNEKESVIDAASHILQKWENYTDESVSIVARTDNEKHHTVTPIARKRNGKFELDLVLRDNQTSEEYPDGIFHPHKDVQHIKKENIGLIEVMGLAILPPRLKAELEQVESYLLNNDCHIAEYHKQWAETIKADNEVITSNNVRQIVRDSVGQKFKRVLEDAGVFKRTVEGQEAFRRFINTLDIE